MRTALVMTVIGPDQTGLVDSLARIVADHGGNWLESRLCRLGGQFAGIIRVEVATDQADALRTAMTANDRQLRIHLQSDAPPGVAGESSLFVVDLVGQDQTGLLQKITGVFTQHDLNVEELSSEITEAPQGGGMLFKAKALVAVPNRADLEAVGADLEKIATDLMVDIRLAPGSAI